MSVYLHQGHWKDSTYSSSSCIDCAGRVLLPGRQLHYCLSTAEFDKLLDHDYLQLTDPLSWPNRARYLHSLLVTRAILVLKRKRPHLICMVRPSEVSYVKKRWSRRVCPKKAQGAVVCGRLDLAPPWLIKRNFCNAQPILRKPLQLFPVIIM